MKRIKKILKKSLMRPRHAYPLVFSHPRSGTHFLEAFIAKNFLEDRDLNIPEITWGHWANRKVKEAGNPYGKLFGSHSFPKPSHRGMPIIYIFRDPRAVAYSVWKTPNFVHPELEDISFSEFIKQPLDWKGSPAFKTDPQWTIFEHWSEHVQAWKTFAEDNTNVLMIRYEDLIAHPYPSYKKIHQSFFKKQPLKLPEEIDPIKKAVGLLPNAAKPASWQEEFSKEDLAFFDSLKEAHPLLDYRS